MTTTTQTETTKTKRPADFYVFMNGPEGQDKKIVGRAYAHKKGKGLTLLIDGKSYAAFPAKQKQETAEATEGAGA